MPRCLVNLTQVSRAGKGHSQIGTPGAVTGQALTHRPLGMGVYTPLSLSSFNHSPSWFGGHKESA